MSLISDGDILLNPHSWEQNYMTWLYKANVWIEYAPVYIIFFLSFLCRLCVMHVSALCMHRLSNTTGPLKSWYHLPKTSAGTELFRPPKACFPHDRCMHFFATVPVIHHLSLNLANQPPALWSVLSSLENQLVSFTCKLEARFMWAQLSGLEIIWSQSLKNS